MNDLLIENAMCAIRIAGVRNNPAIGKFTWGTIMAACDRIHAEDADREELRLMEELA